MVTSIVGKNFNAEDAEFAEEYTAANKIISATSAPSALQAFLNSFGLGFRLPQHLFAVF
jgi:hypothetical protein